MDFYYISSPVVYFSVISFHLDLCVWGPFSTGLGPMVPLYCEVCSLWLWLDQWLAKFSWLGEFVSVFWWVDLYLFSLECNEVSNKELWGVFEFGMTLVIPSFNVQGCVPVLLENQCGGISLELAASWAIEFGFSIGVETFGSALAYFCSPWSGVLWWSNILELSVLPQGFSPSLTLISRLLHPHSTETKGPRLMLKKPSTAKNTQSDSQSYIEKKEGGGR